MQTQAFRCLWWPLPNSNGDDRHALRL